jgi:hypothetical protein
MGFLDRFKKKELNANCNADCYCIEFYTDHPKDENKAYSLMRESTQLKKDGDIQSAISKIIESIKYNPLDSGYTEYIKLAKYHLFIDDVNTCDSIFRGMLKHNDDLNDSNIRWQFRYFINKSQIYDHWAITRYSLKYFEEYIQFRIYSTIFHYFSYQSNFTVDRFDDYYDHLNTYDFSSYSKFKKAVNNLNGDSELLTKVNKIFNDLIKNYYKTIKSSNLLYNKNMGSEIDFNAISYLAESDINLSSNEFKLINNKEFQKNKKTLYNFNEYDFFDKNIKILF